MSKLVAIRSVRSVYPARLLLIDYGLSEKTIQGIAYGLDQLFSIITTYVGIQHVPMFGLIVNGQYQSEIFLPLSSTCASQMELQVALYKLQYLAQKWSVKSVSSLSWHSAFQLASIEMKNKKNHNKRDKNKKEKNRLKKNNNNNRTQKRILIIMSIALFNLAQRLPWNTSLKSSNDDEYSDRLNHRYTVGFLLVCAMIVTGSPFVFNRITCWVPAQFTGAYLSYTNNYCWISNTYYIPSNNTIPSSKLNRKRSEISYYQWTPLILLLSAFGFYFPRLLWRSMNTRSGIDLQYLIGRNNVEEIVHSIEYYCQANEYSTRQKNRFFRSLFCTSGKRLGNYLRSIELMVKFLYLINSLIQLILIHMLLGQSGWFYGVDVWYSIFIKNSVLTDSPYFPRVTLCDLRIREIGNLHQYTVQCVLPINMLNEKVFSLVWFCFVIVFVSNLYAWISTLYRTLITNVRIDFIRDLYRISESKVTTNELLLKKFVRDFLKQDGTLILHLIDHNSDAFIASELVRNLYKNYELAQQEMESRKMKFKLDGTDITEVELSIITNRLSQSIISDIYQCAQSHQIDRKKIELVYVNDDNNNNNKQNILSSDLIDIKYVLENKYSISLYLKSWLLNNDHENEHIQLYLPTNDQSWHMIRCDIREILIDPQHHMDHERFFIYAQPPTIIPNSSLSVPMYQLKALNFIKQSNHCLSMIFGMPLFLVSTVCHKYDPESIKKNKNAFHTLITYLHQNELMLICRLNENQLFSGHFILSVASEYCLIIRSIASSELLLPSPSMFGHQIDRQKEKQLDEELIQSLSSMNIEDEEYNPLYYESRKSKITLNTNLL